MLADAGALAVIAFSGAISGAGSAPEPHAPQLSFDGPYPLLRSAQGVLQDLGRLQDVTLGFVRGAGAKSAGWVNPDGLGLVRATIEPAPCTLHPKP